MKPKKFHNLFLYYYQCINSAMPFCDNENKTQMLVLSSYILVLIGNMSIVVNLPWSMQEFNISLTLFLKAARI